MSRHESRFDLRFGGAKAVAAALAVLMLGGCDAQVLFPAGDVAKQQAHILAVTTGLMLLIIIPVMIATVVFAWKYRESNREATYRPDWDHSTLLELGIWSAPLLIIIAVGAITWISTHTLDPYRPLERIAPGKPVPAGVRPLEVDVVALDWKWLFIYPEQGIATVNELALPVNREVRFRLTASSVMNSFYVPSLVGQVYAMPGMETKLHAVLNRTGNFDGFSANYSGSGFSGMRFRTLGLDEAGFDAWVAKRRTGKLLDRAAYLALEKPSENVRPGFWSAVDPDLFRRVTERCVRAGEPCMSELMRKDMDHPATIHGEAAGKPLPDMPGMKMDGPPGASAAPADPHASHPHS